MCGQKFYLSLGLGDKTIELIARARRPIVAFIYHHVNPVSPFSKLILYSFF